MGRNESDRIGGSGMKVGRRLADLFFTVLADTAADLAGIPEEVGSDAETGGGRWGSPRTPRPGEAAGARARTSRPRQRVGGDVPHQLAG
jgi:hypothetical protein